MVTLRSIKARPFILPAPVLLVGTYDRTGKPNIMLASWGGMCASQPPSLAVSIRKSRWTYAAITERKAFTVSLPTAAMIAKADFAGMHSGSETDKFAALEFTPVMSEHVDAPYVGECPAVIELALTHTVDIGSHTQFIGEIMDVKLAEHCITVDGEPNIAALNPVVYAPLAQEYWNLGTFVARAFSAGHTVTRTAVVG